MSPTHDELTPRQLEVARRVARGSSDREVAEALGVSQQTVRTHLRNIFARLEISSRRELADWLSREDGR